jgi:hypothetical protein
VLFIVPSVFSILVWFSTPYEWLVEWGVNQKASYSTILLPWVVAFAAFVLGVVGQSLLMGTSRGVASGGPSRTMAVRMQWWLTGLAVISLVFVILLATRNGGPTGFLQPYTVRSSYVAGLTTLLHGTTCIIVLASCLYLVDRNVSRISFMALGIACIIVLYRVFIGYERLAVFIPGLAIFILYLRLRYVRITLKLVTFVFSALISLIAIYILAEYFRSYSAKMALGADIESDPLVYGLKRFLLYFAISVNTGGVGFGFFMEGLDIKPLFTVTCPPFAKIFYALFNMESFKLAETHYNSLQLARQMGVYNDEFNNSWSIATSFTEGWVMGIIYWVTWGWIANMLYRNFSRPRPTIWDLCLYGLFVAAFVDNQSRVAMLSAIHFLLPFGIFLLLRSYTTYGNAGRTNH